MLTLFFFSCDSQSRYRQNKGFWRLVSVKDEKRVSETSLRRVKKRFPRPVSVGEGKSVCETSLRRNRKRSLRLVSVGVENRFLRLVSEEAAMGLLRPVSVIQQKGY